jgi:hypothetical protein
VCGCRSIFAPPGPHGTMHENEGIWIFERACDERRRRLFKPAQQVCLR